MKTPPSLENLNKIVLRTITETSTDDSFTRDEKDNYNEEEFKQLIGLRKKFAPRFWCLTISYLISVGIYLFLSTIKEFQICNWVINLKIFNPSDTVLIALLSTTTANIIAVFIVFARFVFPADGIKKK